MQVVRVNIFPRSSKSLLYIQNGHRAFVRCTWNPELNVRFLSAMHKYVNILFIFVFHF